MATTDELAARLCAAAGLEPPTSVQRAALSSANEHFLVDGTFVLRRYRQRAAPHTALVRVRRELRALETLATAGVPVTRVLAACEEPGAESLLVERAKGESLGSWAARLPLDEAAGAWAAAGHALAAVHSVDVGRPTRRRAGPGTTRRYWRISTGSASPAQTCPRSIGCWRWSKMRARSARRLRSRSASATRISGSSCSCVAGRTGSARRYSTGSTPSSPLYTLCRIERAAWILDAHARGHEWPAESVPLAERVLRSRIDG